MINPIRTLQTTDTDIADIVMSNFINLLEMINNLESENCTAGFITASQIADGSITTDKWGIEVIPYNAIGAVLTVNEMQEGIIDYQNLDFTMPVVKILFYTGNGASSRLITHKDFRSDSTPVEAIIPQFMFSYPFGDKRNVSFTFRNKGSSKVIPPNTSDVTYISGVNSGAVVLGSNDDVNASGEQFAMTVVSCSARYDAANVPSGVSVGLINQARYP